jgi:hypothetical protein
VNGYGIEIWIPSFAQEKALNDDKVWDLSQLEKVFTIESKSFDPEEAVLAFKVITKRKWTEKELQADAHNWGGGDWLDKPPIKVIFYNKHEETVFELRGHYFRSQRNPVFGDITKTPIKLTDKQAEEGHLRFRIKLNLDKFPNRLEVATVKFIYPEPK